VLELSAISDYRFSATACVCATRLGRFGKPFIHFFLAGEQLLDTAEALLNSTPQLLARERRAQGALLGPGDLPMDAAA